MLFFVPDTEPGVEDEVAKKKHPFASANFSTTSFHVSDLLNHTRSCQQRLQHGVSTLGHTSQSGKHPRSCKQRVPHATAVYTTRDDSVCHTRTRDGRCAEHATPRRLVCTKLKSATVGRRMSQRTRARVCTTRDDSVHNTETRDGWQEEESAHTRTCENLHAEILHGLSIRHEASDSVFYTLAHYAIHTNTVSNTRATCC